MSITTYEEYIEERENWIKSMNIEDFVNLTKKYNIRVGLFGKKYDKKIGNIFITGLAKQYSVAYVKTTPSELTGFIIDKLTDKNIILKTVVSYHNTPFVVTKTLNINKKKTVAENKLEMDYYEEENIQKKHTSSFTMIPLLETPDQRLFINNLFFDSEKGQKFKYICCNKKENMDNKLSTEICDNSLYKTAVGNASPACILYMDAYCDKNRDDIACSCYSTYKVDDSQVKAENAFFDYANKTGNDIPKQCVSDNCRLYGFKDREIKICPSSCLNVIDVENNGGVIDIEGVRMKITCEKGMSRIVPDTEKSMALADTKDEKWLRDLEKILIIIFLLIFILIIYSSFV